MTPAPGRQPATAGKRAWERPKLHQSDGARNCADQRGQRAIPRAVDKRVRHPAVTDRRRQLLLQQAAPPSSPAPTQVFTFTGAERSCEPPGSASCNQHLPAPHDRSSNLYLDGNQTAYIVLRDATSAPDLGAAQRRR